MDEVMIAPSTDPVKDIDSLIIYVKSIQDYVDLLHCDVMDGEFVERKTISYDTVNYLKENCLLPLDVHLMVSHPEKLVHKFAESGANIITIHAESFEKEKDLIDCIKSIRSFGCLVGISIKPNTPCSVIFNIIHCIDVVLVMSVEPGKSGQSFNRLALDKIQELANYRAKNNLNFKIEVDGGINNTNSKSIIDCGADILVSGSYIFNALNKIEAINLLKG